jgi:hypothetical protein
VRVSKGRVLYSHAFAKSCETVISSTGGSVLHFSGPQSEALLASGLACVLPHVVEDGPDDAAHDASLDRL